MSSCGAVVKNNTCTKSRIVAALLAFFLGGLGIHKFYLNQNLQGILYLVFC
ncbi:TM2 domain-containing protein [Snodgrassella alvi]|uniref:TM2 domain-containing protein n=1 Tax=Snodgrassella alvi TaxID=1196083 RepID=UPI001C557C21|nr:TM2 domain-containing protein [Snodgrassella alvi]